MNVKIKNNIRQLVEDYQERTGASKKWIADQLDISTQWLFKIFEKDNMDYKTLVKLSILLNCDLQSLMEIHVEKD